MISNEKFRGEIAHNAIVMRDKNSISNIMKKWNNVLNT